MHGINDDVDMRHYGALRKLMPVTFLTFAMGYLAIIGFPGFAGFWSKDKIIETAFAQNSWSASAPWSVPASPAFYMTRLMLMTFFTKKRWEQDVHPHESPKVMTVPADRAGRAVGPRRPAAAQRLDRRLAGTGGRARRARGATAACLAITPIIVARGRDRGGLAWLLFGEAGGAAGGADQGLGVHHRAAATSCTATRSTTR